MDLENNKKGLQEDQPLPRRRRELEVFQQIFSGQPYWVYKDPLSLRYYRFSREEHFIIELLHEGVTLRQLRERHHRRFKSELLTNNEVGMFISSLLSKNLLVVTQPNRDELLYNSSQKTRRAKLFGQFTNFLFIKIPLYDPDRLFNRMIPYLRFIWSNTFLLIYLASLSLGALLIIMRWHDFVDMMQTSFFTVYNLPMLLAVGWLTKSLHEFGHGLTCKNYGGEVHELGFLILVFMPMLYCNITDSWTFPNKAHRFLTTAGGILTELFLAALAAIVWYFTESPGFIHAFAFNIVLLCSISTILFNANPLLRFDGYYILMDIIEIPNLRQRSAKLMRSFFLRHILGGHTEQMPEEHRFRFIFPLYAVGAFVYRWFIVGMILFGIYYMFKRMHLVVLGQLFVMVSVATTLILPLSMGGKKLVKQREALGISNIRLLMLLLIIVVIGAMALFWPLSQHVTLNFILEPTQIRWLRSEVPGQLAWSDNIQEGAWLEDAEVLAFLDNPELDCEAKRNRAQIEQCRIERDQNKEIGGLESRIEYLADRMKTLQSDQRRIGEQIDNQQVKAPFAGRILTLNEQIRTMQDSYVPLGSPLVLIGDTRELTAKVWVPEKTWARIFRSAEQRGQAAEMMLYAFTKDKFYGSVSKVSSHCEDNMGIFNEKLALSNKVGGEVLTEYDYKTDREKPMEAVYEVSINIDEGSLPDSAKPYMSGRVQIDCGRYTLYQWGKESLLRFISPEVRL